MMRCGTDESRLMRVYAPRPIPKDARLIRSLSAAFCRIARTRSATESAATPTPM